MPGAMDSESRAVDRMAAYALPKAPEPNDAALKAVGYAIIGMTLGYLLHRFGVRADVSEVVGLAAVWVAARYDSNRGWQKYRHARSEARARLKDQADAGSTAASGRSR